MSDTPTIDRLSALLDDESLEVIEEIHKSDGMYLTETELYWVAGREALRYIRLAMLAANQTRVDRILDFASGSGRVLRYLKAAFPDAELTACEVLKDDLEFCARVFGAKAVEGKLNPADTQLESQYDLIWCGSLLTHTNQEDFQGFLKLFDSVLAPGGVLVFTTMGRCVAFALRNGVSRLPLSADDEEQVTRDYDSGGFGFSNGSRDPATRMGDAVASPAWVCEQIDALTELRLLLFLEESWLGQDVVACTKDARRFAPGLRYDRATGRAVPSQ